MSINKDIGIIQIMEYSRPNRKNSDRYRVFSKDGIGPTLNTMQGGNLQPFIIENEDEIEKWWFDGN